jgi:hypothetical protein
MWNTVMKLIRESTIAFALFWLTTIAGGYGCSRQFSPSAPPYPLPLALQAPLGSTYPGVRELMDAPSNDPAINDDEVRP